MDDNNHQDSNQQHQTIEPSNSQLPDQQIQIYNSLNRIIPGDETLKSNFTCFAQQLAKIPPPNNIQDFEELRIQDILIPELKYLANLIAYKPSDKKLLEIMEVEQKNDGSISIDLEKLKSNDRFLQWHLVACLSSVEQTMAACLRFLIFSWFRCGVKSRSSKKRLRNNTESEDNWVDCIPSQELRNTLENLNNSVKFLLDNNKNPLHIYNITGLDTAFKQLQITENNLKKGQQSIEQLHTQANEHHDALHYLNDQMMNQANLNEKRNYELWQMSEARKKELNVVNKNFAESTTSLMNNFASLEQKLMQQEQMNQATEAKMSLILEKLNTIQTMQQQPPRIEIPSYKTPEKSSKMVSQTINSAYEESDTETQKIEKLRARIRSSKESFETSSPNKTRLDFDEHDQNSIFNYLPKIPQNPITSPTPNRQSYQTNFLRSDHSQRMFNNQPKQPKIDWSELGGVSVNGLSFYLKNKWELYCFNEHIPVEESIHQIPHLFNSCSINKDLITKRIMEFQKALDAKNANFQTSDFRDLSYWLLHDHQTKYEADIQEVSVAGTLKLMTFKENTTILSTFKKVHRLLMTANPLLSNVETIEKFKQQIQSIVTRQRTGTRPSYLVHCILSDIEEMMNKNKWISAQDFADLLDLANAADKKQGQGTSHTLKVNHVENAENDVEEGDKTGENLDKNDSEQKVDINHTKADTQKKKKKFSKKKFTPQPGMLQCEGKKGDGKSCGRFYFPSMNPRHSKCSLCGNPIVTIPVDYNSKVSKSTNSKISSSSALKIPSSNPSPNSSLKINTITESTNPLLQIPLICDQVIKLDFPVNHMRSKMKGFAWIRMRPEGEGLGDDELEELMVDSGSQVTIVNDKIMNKWIKKGAKVKKIPSKWKNIVTYSDTAMEVENVYLIDSITLRDDFSNQATLKNITVIVLSDIKFGLCGQNLRSELEHKNRQILLSIASLGKSKIQNMDFKFQTEPKLINNLSLANNVVDQLDMPIIQTCQTLHGSDNFEDQNSLVANFTSILDDLGQMNINTETKADKSTVNRLINGKSFKVGANIPESNALQLENLIKKYDEVFTNTEKVSMLEMDPIEIEIMEDAKIPKTCKFKSASKKMTKVMQLKMDRQINDKTMKMSDAEALANSFLIDKKNGRNLDDPERYRFVTDFRAINKIIKPVDFKLPRIDQVQSDLAEFKYFGKFDIANAFSIIPIRCKIPLTINPSGLQQNYEYTSLPQGMGSSSAIFQREMSNIFCSLNGFVLNYLDDFFVGGNSYAELIENFGKFFQLCQKAGIKLTPKKAVMGVESISCLGRRIAHQAITMSEDHKRAILEMDGSKMDNDRLCGILQYIAPFIGINSATTIKLFRKGPWNDFKENSLQEIKTKLKNSQWLTNFSEDKTIVLASDASSTSIGACLFEAPLAKNNPKWSNGYLKKMRLIDIKSKNMTETQSYRAADPFLREVVALQWATKKYLPQLMKAKKAVILTDSRSIILAQSSTMIKSKLTLYLQTLKDQIPGIQLIHIDGKRNSLADQLSRPKLQKNLIFPEMKQTSASAPIWEFQFVDSVVLDDKEPVNDEVVIKLWGTPNTLSSIQTNTQFVNPVGLRKLNNNKTRKQPLLRASKSDLKLIADSEKSDSENNESRNKNTPTAIDTNETPEMSESEMKNQAQLAFNNMSQLMKHKMMLLIIHKLHGHLAGPRLKQIYDNLTELRILSQNQIDDLIRTKCSCYKPRTPKNAATITPTTISEILYLDTFKIKVKINNKGREIICLTALEPLSRLVHMVILKNETAQEVMAALGSLLQFLGNFTVIKADNGPCFRSALFKNFINLLGIDLQFCLPRRPQSNLSERFHSTVTKALMAQSFSSMEQVLAKLTLTIQAYNSTTGRNHVASPIELWRNQRINLLEPKKATPLEKSLSQILQEQFDKIQASKPKGSSAQKNFEVGQQIIGSYMAGNKRITHEGTVVFSEPNVIGIKKDDGEIKKMHPTLCHRPNDLSYLFDWKELTETENPDNSVLLEDNTLER